MGWRVLSWPLGKLSLKFPNVLCELGLDRSAHWLACGKSGTGLLHVGSYCNPTLTVGLQWVILTCPICGIQPKTASITAQHKATNLLKMRYFCDFFKNSIAWSRVNYADVRGVL